MVKLIADYLPDKKGDSENVKKKDSHGCKQTEGSQDGHALKDKRKQNILGKRISKMVKDLIL